MRIPVMSSDASLYKSEIPYRSSGIFAVSGGITPQWDCMSRCLEGCSYSPLCPVLCWYLCHRVKYDGDGLI